MLDLERADTKERIIWTAAAMFARKGYAATSLRHLTTEAEVNVAAVNYHYGSKEQLLIEVLDRIVAPLNEDRLRRLDKLESRADPPTLEEILTAFLAPDMELIVELRERDPSLPLFVARMYTEGSELMVDVTGRQFAEIQRRFLAALSSALPHLERDEIAWRLHCLVGIVIYLFAGIPVPGVGPPVDADSQRTLRRLLHIAIPLVGDEEVA